MAGEGWEVEGTHPGRVLCAGDRVHVFARAGTVSFAVPDPFDRGGDEEGHGLSLSPMPGLVRELAVAPGDRVAKGDRLAVIEAMKMEHVLTAARDGTVAEVLVTAGAQVEAGAALVRLEEADG